jgi:hypothetical protein
MTIVSTKPSTPDTGSTAFGVGCFHFRAIRARLGKGAMSVAEYVEDLKEQLSLIPSIPYVDIQVHTAGEDSEFDVQPNARPLHAGGDPTPNPVFLEIHFRVTIPKRVQQELQKHPVLEELGTNFGVYISYQYQGPVAFVEPLDSETESPSSAVVLVREFMQRELRLRQTSFVFESIGPSPFHADFFLEPAVAKPVSPLAATIVPTGAYDEVRFLYDPDVLDHSEALEAVFERVATELDHYYYLQRVEVIRYDAWERLSKSLRNLIKLEQMRGLRGSSHRLLRRSGLVHSATIATIQFQSDELIAANNVRKSFLQTFEDGASHHLTELVKRDFDTRQQFPIEEAGKLLGFVEARRSEALNQVVVLAAAVVGGIAGSAITLLAHDSPASNRAASSANAPHKPESIAVPQQP